MSQHIHLKTIILYSIIACLLLYVTENIFHPVYSVQLIQKLFLFIIVPLLWSYFILKSLQ